MWHMPTREEMDPAVSENSLGHLYPNYWNDRILLIHFSSLFSLWTETAKSVQLLATGWMIRGSNPGTGMGFCSSRNVHTKFGAHTVSCSKWIRGFFPRAERPEHEVNHSPLSSTEVKNKWSFTSDLPIYLHGVNRDNCFSVLLYSNLMYCIVLYCIVLYCIVLYSIVLYSIVLYSILFYSIRSFL